MDDWEINTDYEGYKKDDITIINFWKVILISTLINYNLKIKNNINIKLFIYTNTL